MMPPPPPQIRHRDETQSRALTLPVKNATQHREIYHRSQDTSTLQPPTEEIGRTKRFADSRALDMSNPPIRPQPTIGTQVRHVHDRQMNDSVAYDEPMDLATTNRTLESSSGRNQRQIVNQQTYVPRPTESHSIDRTGRFTHTRDTALEHCQQRPTRQPLRPVPVDGIGLQTPKRTSYPCVGPKPFLSPLRASQPTAGLISSPFFQREASTSHMASRQRPSPRGRDMSQISTHHDLRLGATARSQWLHESNGTPDARDQLRLPARRNPSSDYGSFEPPPSTATLPYRGLTAASQTSGHLQPVYNSHAYPSSMRPPVERQFNPTSRGRVTLPPSKSSSQDYELSSIQGLRGGYPQRAGSFPSQQYPGYTGSRPLFSATSRRSVRR